MQMLAVVADILKIIGIILLCIIAILLAVILLALFCPWRYCVDVRKEGKLTGKAAVSWLLHILMAEVIYCDAVNLRIRVFGIPVYDKSKREARAAEKEKAAKERKARAEEKAAKKRKTERDQEARQREETAPKPPDTEGNQQPQPDMTAASVDAETPAEGQYVQDNEGQGRNENVQDRIAQDRNVHNEKLKDKITQDQNVRKEDVQDKTAQGKNIRKEKDQDKTVRRKNGKVWWEFPQYFFELLMEWAQKLLEMLLFLPELIEGPVEELEKKILSVVDQAQYYMKLLQKKGSKWVIGFLKIRIFKVLKHIRPRHSKIDLYYAADDPAKAADMMAYYGMALPFLPKHTNFTAELGEPRLEGTIRIKGRVCLIVILWHGLSVILNKKVKTFLKLFKEGRKTTA